MAKIYRNRVRHRHPTTSTYDAKLFLMKHKIGERQDRLTDTMTSFKDPMAETLKTDLERQGLRMESARSSGNTKINCVGPTRSTPTRASPMPRRQTKYFLPERQDLRVRRQDRQHGPTIAEATRSTSVVRDRFRRTLDPETEPRTPEPQDRRDP